MGGHLTYLAHLVVTELEEHWQELLIDDFLVKEHGVFPQVLSQYLLCAPVILSIIISLEDVFDEFLSVLGLDFLQEDMEVLQCTNFDFIKLVFEELFEDGNQILFCDFGTQETSQFVN